MNTYKPYTVVTEEFLFPSSPDVGTAVATVSYEWGNVVLSEVAATQVSGNNYSVTIPDDLLDAAGVWRIKWECTISTTAFYAYTNFEVKSQYVTEDEFMLDYPEFNTIEFQGSMFSRAELVARATIDTYCGQDFQFIKNKTITLEGNGRSKLHLPSRLNWTTSSTIEGEDYTSAILLDPSSKYFVKTASTDYVNGNLSLQKFPSGSSITITGDWGWISVPNQIKEATKLLIVDLLDEAKREMHRYGIVRLWQDTNRVELKNGIFNTTGNIDVDVLIMDYIYWTMDYVT